MFLIANFSSGFIYVTTHNSNLTGLFYFEFFHANFWLVTPRIILNSVMALSLQTRLPTFNSIVCGFTSISPI